MSEGRVQLAISSTAPRRRSWWIIGCACLAVLFLFGLGALCLLLSIRNRTYADAFRVPLRADWPAYPGAKVISSENTEWEVLSVSRGTLGQRVRIRFVKKIVLDVSGLDADALKGKAICRHYVTHVMGMGLYDRGLVGGYGCAITGDEKKGGSTVTGPQGKLRINLRRTKTDSDHTVTLVITVDHGDLWAK